MAILKKMLKMSDNNLNWFHKIFLQFTGRLHKRKLAILFALTINCVFLYMMMSGVNEEHKYYKTNKFKYVVVHIDLKGAPPKISFLKSMLKEVKLLGANALLMEYEDMFPYENELKNLSQPEHYKKSDLTDFLTEANAIGVEIIPLIQTFGHMESVLKLDEFKYLREDSTYLDSICPSKLGTEILIAAMLRQVIKLHQAVVPLRHIHVGCDEVWNINKCDKCLKQKLQNHEIFFKHLDTVTNLVRNVSPSTTVLFWDDMMRRLSPTQIKGLKMISKLEPVVWNYHPPLDAMNLPLYLYHRNFDNIWIASAFKGADGNSNAIPQYQKRTENTLAWLNFINGYKFGGESEIYNFQGIILTGWSRYNHFAPLCDLLPVSYQSLITSLVIINKYQNGIKLEELNFIEWVKDDEVTFKNNFRNDYYKLVECQVTKCLLNITTLTYKIVKQYEDFIVKAIKDPKFQASVQIEAKPKPNEWCNLLANTLKSVEEKLMSNMRLYYSWNVQQEYMQRSYLLYKAINKECSGYLY